MTIVPPGGAEAEGDVPDPDVLAYRLVARESPLDRTVLHELIGRPKRYADLKPLLGEKGDHNLTVSLKRLQEWGLIERRTDARREPVVHVYELTPLGIQVVLAIPAIQPIHESLARFEHARLSALADLRNRLAHGAHPGAAGNVGNAPSAEDAAGAGLAMAAMMSYIDETILRMAMEGPVRVEPHLEEHGE